MPTPPSPATFWDAQFGTADYAYGEQPNDFLRQRHADIPKGRVLCLAAGEGRNAVFLAEQGHAVTAVDISPVGLEKTRALAEKRGVQVETVRADLGAFDPGEGVWDGITAISCHLPPDARAQLFGRLARALRPGGVFLVEGYTPAQLGRGTGGPPSAAFMLSAAVLRRDAPGLTWTHLEEMEREVVEGRNHTGMAAVVQGIGRR